MIQEGEGGKSSNSLVFPNLRNWGGIYCTVWRTCDKEKDRIRGRGGGNNINKILDLTLEEEEKTFKNQKLYEKNY